MAVLVDIDNSYKIIRQATQRLDGLFYIAYDGSTVGHVRGNKHDMALLGSSKDLSKDAQHELLNNGIDKDEDEREVLKRSSTAKVENSSCSVELAMLCNCFSDMPSLWTSLSVTWLLEV